MPNEYLSWPAGVVKHVTEQTLKRFLELIAQPRSCAFCLGELKHTDTFACPRCGWKVGA